MLFVLNVRHPFALLFKWHDVGLYIHFSEHFKQARILQYYEITLLQNHTPSRAEAVQNLEIRV